MKLKHLLFLAPLALFSVACVAPTEGEELGESSQAAGVGRFRPGGGGGGVRNFGGACKFQGDARGPADAFTIANGQDVSIVFTKLGEGSRRPGRSGMSQSRCSFAIPLDVPAGSFLSGWSQTLQYGIVKPAGVRAGLGLDSAIQNVGAPFPMGGGPGGGGPGGGGGGPGGGGPGGGGHRHFGPGRVLGAGMFQLPSISVDFDEPALNVTLATATAPTDGFAETDPRYSLWRARWCAAARSPNVEFVGSAYTWAERTAAGVDPVIIAIDGLDARFDLGTIAEVCPVSPLPPPGPTPPPRGPTPPPRGPTPTPPPRR